MSQINETTLDLLRDWSLDDEYVETTVETDDVDEQRPGSPSHQIIDYYDDVKNNRCVSQELIDIEDDASDASDVSLEANPFDGLPYSSMYFMLLERRKRLSIWQAKDDFVLAVDESSIILLTGPSGSGKSTQGILEKIVKHQILGPGTICTILHFYLVPQWCAHLAKDVDFRCGSVVSCMPSAHTAVSLATQIAQEMDFTSVGLEVGYDVPQMKCWNEETILKTCTDDILLREMLGDPLLQKYNYIIIDDVQERTVCIDMLLALVKFVTQLREDLKVIIICQVHEMKKLEDFFEGVPVVDLYFLEYESLSQDDERDDSSAEEEILKRKEAENKRLRTIDIRYLELFEDRNLVQEVALLVARLHSRKELEGDFLVFLSSKKEIEQACEQITREVAIKSLRGEADDLLVLPLHRGLAVGSQQVLYHERHQGGRDVRRVIVSDNLGEMFCVDNISVVIDSGYKQESVYDCRIRTHTNIKKLISKSNALLRTDKCAVSGSVYRIYREEDYETMEGDSQPWMVRSELTSQVLLLKRLLERLDIPRAKFHLMQSPAPEAHMMALEELDYQGALNENGGLSDLGAVMSELPLSVAQAKSVIASCGETCTQEMLTIVSMLSVFPFCLVAPGERKLEAMKRRKELEHEAGGHFTLLNIYNQFINHKSSEVWSTRNFLDYGCLKRAERKRSEVLEIMERLELPISDSITDPDVLEMSVKKALLAGYFMQVARITDGCGNYHLIRDKHIARINDHMFPHKQPEWLIFDQFELAENNSISVVSGVTAEWVVEIMPGSYLANLPQSESKDLLLKAIDKRGRLPDANEYDGDITEQITSSNGSRLKATDEKSTWKHSHGGLVSAEGTVEHDYYAEQAQCSVQ